MDNDIRDRLKQRLIFALRKKLENYNPEPASMPFHKRLLGQDRIALFSFIQSLNTNFGVTIFEPIAVEFAKQKFKIAETQQTAGKYIFSEAHNQIQHIIDELATQNIIPTKEQEIERLRKVCRTGTKIPVKLTKVDLKLIDFDDKIYLIDIKTAKPNFGQFKEFKRTLLEWVAATLADNPTADIQTLIAIPYNPYEPKPYDRWTMKGMIDINNELKVAAEFWDFLSKTTVYNDLLDLFEEVGNILRPEIDKYFSKFRQEN
ncbi:MAG TPA: TdeIII family type II restriction endonuclease [Melioribacteraceae bacterium]|nr:TdeIII family type II restriction endonuclease [Melioribacteraceae bacterium]